MLKTAILTAVGIFLIAGPAAAKPKTVSTAAYGTNVPGSGCIDGPTVVGIESPR